MTPKKDGAVASESLGGEAANSNHRIAVPGSPIAEAFKKIEVRDFSIGVPLSTASRPANEWRIDYTKSTEAAEPALADPQAKPRGWPAALLPLVQWAWKAYRREREIGRAVAHLAALDDRTLKDIGLHRSEIENAVRRGRFF